MRLKNNDEGMKTYKTKLKHGDVQVDYFESAKSLQPIECNKAGDIVLLIELLSKITSYSDKRKLKWGASSQGSFGPNST